MPEVLIRQKKTGAEYAIQSGAFARGKHYRDPDTGELSTYEEAGFEIVALHPSGEPYEPPAAAAESGARAEAEPEPRRSRGKE